MDRLLNDSRPDKSIEINSFQVHVNCNTEFFYFSRNKKKTILETLQNTWLLVDLKNGKLFSSNYIV